MKYFRLIILLSIILLPAAGAWAGDDELFSRFQDRSKYQNVLVERVLSADTIVLEGGERIKLIGLKAPEAPRRPKIKYDKNGQPMEPEVLPENTFEEKAFAFTAHLLEGKFVRLEFDDQRKDENFTSVAYVFLVKDKTFANVEILRQGFADLQIRPPNFKYADQLRAAYREARREKRGMQGG